MKLGLEILGTILVVYVVGGLAYLEWLQHFRPWTLNEMGLDE